MKSASVKKRFDFISQKREGIHTKISFYLSILAIVGMTYLGLTHINDIDYYGEAWGRYALYFAFFGLIAYLGIELLDGNNLDFPPVVKDFEPSSFLTMIFIAIPLYIVQIGISVFRFSVSSTDKAMYFIFAAVIEELVFRGFLLELFLLGDKKGNKLKMITAVVATSLMFAAVHQNYYDEPVKLIGVFLSGFVLGFVYVWKRDLTANMLAHFLINAWAAIEILGTVQI